MSKKFFSLIHGQPVHISPETKVISGEAISTVLDSKELLELVKKDAKQYKMEITSECEKIKEEATRKGFESGFIQWAEKLAELETEIIKVRKDMERLISPLAVKAAKKIVGRELKIDESTIIDIITTSLKSVAQHKKINIFVNKNDFEQVEKNREKIKSVFESLEALSIIPQEEIEEGGCIIETEGGIINAQLENKWLILEHAFSKMIKDHAQKFEKKVKG